MKKTKSLIFLVALLTAIAGFRTSSDLGVHRLDVADFQKKDTLKIDPETGLITDKHLVLVKANCTGCHSTKLISQHRFTREGWVGKIRWMQQYHNLWNLGESESNILDYLEKHYSPQSSSNGLPARRAPLKNIEWYKLE